MTNSADPDQLASDLDLHSLLRQDMTCSAREGLKCSLQHYCRHNNIFNLKYSEVRECVAVKRIGHIFEEDSF